MVRICLECIRPGFNPWVRKIAWRRKWQPTPVFLPEKPQEQRSLAGYSPWGHKESDTTEGLTRTHGLGGLVLELAHGCFHIKQRRKVCLLWLEKSSKPCFCPHMFAFKVSMVSMETTQRLLKKKFKKSRSFHVSHYVMQVPDFRPQGTTPGAGLECDTFCWIINEWIESSRHLLKRVKCYILQDIC